MSEPQFRRHQGLFVAFEPGHVLITDAVRGRRLTVESATLDVLSDLADWTSARQLTSRRPGLRLPIARRFLQDLWKAGLLERIGDPASPSSSPVWKAWGPEATAYHFLARAERYSTTPMQVEAALRRKARHTPRPAPVQRRTGRRYVLPRLAALGDSAGLASALLDRRTWRRFGRKALTVADLGALLQFTFGVQRWGLVRGLGRVPLKTSPSGGACHSIESYVLVNRVDAIPPGFYHYEADRHVVTRVRSGGGVRAVRACLQSQPWFDRAAILVFLCPVFARTAWRYPTPRAYRSVLIEAGHLGQTFCLVATARGLAPFTTLAVDDLKVDEALGLDGGSQGVIYVVGCGTAPVTGWQSGVPFGREVS